MKHGIFNVRHDRPTHPSSSSDPILYEGLDQVIVCAAVVPPKRDMFVDEVRYMLVLATPVEIVLLAVHIDKDTQAIQLIDSSLHHLPLRC